MKSPWLPISLLIVGSLVESPRATADDTFEKEVRPLLVQNCIGCHGPDKQKGGLRLDSRPGWQTGGVRGPAIQPGRPEDSLVIKAVQGRDGLKRMPPEGRLTEREVSILTRWIKEGALDPRDGIPMRLGGTTVEAARKWWAFRPLKRPVVPKGDFTNPIDAFIAARLRE